MPYSSSSSINDVAAAAAAAATRAASQRHLANRHELRVSGSDSYELLFLFLKAYAVFRFILFYAIPVTVFAYCYGRIFHTIKRQSKVLAGHGGRSQDIPMATTSRDPNAGQVQQQATGTTIGAKLSHTYHHHHHYHHHHYFYYYSTTGVKAGRVRVCRVTGKTL